MELIYFNLFFSKKIPKPKINSKGGNMQKTENNSVQNWLPFESILENGTIKINSNEYIKILKINPSRKCHMRDFIKGTVLGTDRTIQRVCYNDLRILQFLFHRLFPEHYFVVPAKQRFAFL